MFRFSSPEYLHLLWLLLMLIVIYVGQGYRLRRKRLLLADKSLCERLTMGHSRTRGIVKISLQLVALAALVVVVARPQYGLGKGTERSEGIEAAIVMDVSNSMMANDVSPSRLDRSKLLVNNLIDRMEDDRIALAVFAGEAYPLMPITQDYASAKIFLETMSPTMVTLQGTNLAAAIELGSASFSARKEVGKAIIVITDGENHEGGAREAAEEAAKKGRKLFVIGVGSPGGSAIPLSGGGVLTDNEGKPVKTALNEELCREIAKAGKGIYLHLDNSNTAQDALLEAVHAMQKAESSSTFSEYDEQFQAVALIALFLLLIEFFMRETPNPFFQRFKLFTRL